MSTKISILKGAGKDVTTDPIETRSDNGLLSWGGTFSGETITLQVWEQTGWEPVTGAVFSAAGQQLLKLAKGKRIRAVTSNGAGTPSLNMSLESRFS